MEDLYPSQDEGVYKLGTVGRYAFTMEEIAYLKRNRSTEIELNAKDQISLRKLLPNREIRTVQLRYTKEEAALIEQYHYIWAKFHQREMRVPRGWREGHGDDTKQEKSNLPNVARAGQILTCLTISPRLVALNLELEFLKGFEDDVECFRGKEHVARSLWLE